MDTGFPSATSPRGKYVATGHQLRDTATGLLLGERPQAAPAGPLTEAGEVVTCNRGDNVEIWDALEGAHTGHLQQPPETDTGRMAAIRIDCKIVV